MVEDPQVGQPVVLTETWVSTEDRGKIRMPQQYGRVVELLGGLTPIAGHPSTQIRIATPGGNVIRTGTFHVRTMTETDLETLKEAEADHAANDPDEPIYAGLWDHPPEKS